MRLPRVGKIQTTLVLRANLLVQALERVGGGELGQMLAREVHKWWLQIGGEQDTPRTQLLRKALAGRQAEIRSSYRRTPVARERHPAHLLSHVSCSVLFPDKSERIRASTAIHPPPKASQKSCHITRCHLHCKTTGAPVRTSYVLDSFQPMTTTWLPSPHRRLNSALLSALPKRA